MLAQNRVLRGHYFAVSALANERPTARLGIIAARKAIRRAVDRNTCKRIVREAFREHAAALSGLDVVVVCRAGLSGKNRPLARRELDRFLPGLSEDRRMAGENGLNGAEDPR